MIPEPVLRRFCKDLFSAVDCLHDRQSLILHDELAKLTLTQLRMLKTIYVLTEESGSGVALKTVAEALGITPAAASEMVNALVGKQVLDRIANEQDRRSVDIRIAPGLLDKIHNSEREYADSVLAYFGRLDENSQREFLDLVSGFARYMELTQKP